MVLGVVGLLDGLCNSQFFDTALRNSRLFSQKATGITLKSFEAVLTYTGLAPRAIEFLTAAVALQSLSLLIEIFFRDTKVSRQQKAQNESIRLLRCRWFYPEVNPDWVPDHALRSLVDSWVGKKRDNSIRKTYQVDFLRVFESKVKTDLETLHQKDGIGTANLPEIVRSIPRRDRRPRSEFPTSLLRIINDKKTRVDGSMARPDGSATLTPEKDASSGAESLQSSPRVFPVPKERAKTERGLKKRTVERPEAHPTLISETFADRNAGSAGPGTKEKKNAGLGARTRRRNLVAELQRITPPKSPAKKFPSPKIPFPKPRTPESSAHRALYDEHNARVIEAGIQKALGIPQVMGSLRTTAACPSPSNIAPENPMHQARVKKEHAHSSDEWEIQEQVFRTTGERKSDSSPPPRRSRCPSRRTEHTLQSLLQNAISAKRKEDRNQNRTKEIVWGDKVPTRQFWTHTLERLRSQESCSEMLDRIAYGHRMSPPPLPVGSRAPRKVHARRQPSYTWPPWTATATLTPGKQDNHDVRPSERPYTRLVHSPVQLLSRCNDSEPCSSPRSLFFEDTSPPPSLFLCAPPPGLSTPSYTAASQEKHCTDSVATDYRQDRLSVKMQETEDILQRYTPRVRSGLPFRPSKAPPLPSQTRLGGRRLLVLTLNTVTAATVPTAVKTLLSLNPSKTGLLVMREYIRWVSKQTEVLTPVYAQLCDSFICAALPSCPPMVHFLTGELRSIVEKRQTPRYERLSCARFLAHLGSDIFSSAHFQELIFDILDQQALPLVSQLEAVKAMLEVRGRNLSCTQFFGDRVRIRMKKLFDEEGYSTRTRIVILEIVDGFKRGWLPKAWQIEQRQETPVAAVAASVPRPRSYPILATQATGKHTSSSRSLQPYGSATDVNSQGTVTGDDWQSVYLNKPRDMSFHDTSNQDITPVSPNNSEEELIALKAYFARRWDSKNVELNRC